MKNNNEIQIQFVPIEFLEYNNGQIPGVPENPRTREDTKQRNLEKSIEELPEMTIARAALCFPYNGRFVVIGGNRRLEAQRALKRKEVPIIALPEDTPVEKLRRMALLDNESTGQTDWAKLAKDWSKDEIRAWNIETPKGWFNEAPGKKAEEDNYTEPKKLKPRVKPSEIWQLGEHRLMCGDSTDAASVALLMDGQKADMVFTDPPYGMSAVSKSGVLQKRYKTDIMNDDTNEVAINSFKLCQKMFSNAKQVWWGANYYTECLPSSECWIVWDKNNGASDQTDCELAWANFRSVVRQFTMASEKKDRVHPTQKPIKLITDIIDKFEKDKRFDVIVDLFGGSGSTLIACEQLNRKCYMMELTEHYCDVIINRWETLTGHKAVKIGWYGKVQ